MKSTICSVKVREAKDFLVQQTVEQAQRENVPLSDLEKRMMYFTEENSALEDPVSLNDEFEKQYDTAKYEKKISLLMKHAYGRIKKEDPQKTLQWNSALRVLRRGDHYILVLFGGASARSSSIGWRMYLAFGLFFGLPFTAFLIFAHFFFPTRSGVWRYSNSIPLINSHIVQVLFLLLVIICVFFPRLLSKATDWWFRFFDRLAGLDKKEAEEDN